MNKFEQFKQKCNGRTSKDGYILEQYRLFIDGREVMYVYEHIDKDGEKRIVANYVGCYLADEIYRYDVDENNEYRIEWFVLENEDE